MGKLLLIEKYLSDVLPCASQCAREDEKQLYSWEADNLIGGKNPTHMKQL